MTLLDFLIAILIIYYSWKGYNNGLIREVFRIVGLVLACFLSFKLANSFAPLLVPIFSIEPYLYPYVAFVVLFILILILVYFAIRFFDRLIQILLLSIPNRILGSVFGFLKSSLLISITLIILGGFDIPSEDTRNRSRFYEPLLKVAPVSFDIVAKVLPGVKSYKESVEDYISIPDVTFPDRSEIFNDLFQD